MECRNFFRDYRSAFPLPLVRERGWGEGLPAACLRNPAGRLQYAQSFRGMSTMRQAEVQALFLQRFGEVYPQLQFRGLRRFPDRSYAPYALALRVALGKSRHELDLLCIILTEGHPEEVRHFLRQVSQARPNSGYGEALIALVAPYFSEEAQALCREAGVGYLDLAGNAYLETDRAYLLLTGKPNPLARKREVQSPLRGRAERVVRRLLLEPGRTWALRALAEAAQVSLGLTSMVTTALAKSGWVAKTRQGVSLLDAKGLLEAWANVYDLRNSPFIAYRAWDDPAILERRLVQNKGLAGHYALTLWSGAHHLLGEVETPGHMALFWRGAPEDLAQALRLSRDVGKGYVFVFQPYDESLLWGAVQTAEGLMVAHPLQLYLDLGSGDERELALAQRVREALLPW